ncbi:uncharacterized protein LOC143693412 isoform X1 [Agelaius phoeniceus]|uniref:uncharacterized protein LOC143693412 isoform X1 n=2 Tax=Agelaius phoeniceus TaxID=39638 RepID=UPI004055004F
MCSPKRCQGSSKENPDLPAKWELRGNKSSKAVYQIVRKCLQNGQHEASTKIYQRMSQKNPTFWNQDKGRTMAPEVQMLFLCEQPCPHKQITIPLLTQSLCAITQLAARQRFGISSSSDWKPRSQKPCGSQLPSALQGSGLLHSCPQGSANPRLPQASWRQMRGGPGGSLKNPLDVMPRGGTEGKSGRISANLTAQLETLYWLCAAKLKGLR